MKLTPLLFLSVFIAVLIPVSILGIYFFNEKEKEILTELDDYHADLLKSLQISLADAVWSYRQDIARDMVKPLFGSDVVVSVRVDDESGNLFIEEKNPNISPREVSTLGAEIHNKEMLVGKLRVTVSQEPALEQIQEEVYRILTVMFSLFLSIFLVIYLILKHYIIKPMQNLYQETQKFEDGHFDDPVSISGAHEIEILGQHIDGARQRIKSLIGTLQIKYQELSEAHTELIDTQNRLIESEKMASLGNLVAGLAHEINTPIGISVTSASHLKSQTTDLKKTFESGAIKKSTITKYIEDADTSTSLTLKNLGRASELIQEFKRVSVDHTDEHLKSFEIISYTHDLLNMLRPQISTDKVKLSLEAEGEIEVYSYPGLYSQIITNMAMNAYIHAFDKSGPGEIQFSISPDHENVLIRCCDDGKGISEENLQKVFEPFFTTRRNQGGIGLGMHIMYNIITQRLMGSISIESTLGEGTCLKLSLPKEVKSLQEKAS